jgi:hypothetical protein
MEKALYKKEKCMMELECLVGKRFETLGALRDYLIDTLKPTRPLEMEFASQNYEIGHTPDWNLVGNIENDDIFCDFDIYFLFDRENNLYVTEVWYEFE